MTLFKLSSFKDLFIDAKDVDESTPEAVAIDATLHADDLVIAFATQSGAAEIFAKDTARHLQQHGIATQVLEFYDVDLALLQQTQQMLIIVSTTYDGEPPDMAEEFCEDYMQDTANLEHLTYALLALGDRAYDEFCGFGHRLERWLQAAHAKAFFSITEVDDESDRDVRRWFEKLDALVAASHAPLTAETG